MSKILQTYLGLEELTEEVSATIAADEPTADNADFDGEIGGVPYQEESTAINDDIDQIVKSAQGLEDIISVVEDAPGADDAPLEPFVEKSMNLALESNDLVEEAGNPVAGSADKSKSAVLAKLKDFAARVWKMLREFGKKIADWVRQSWARFTDQIVKNGNTAKKILESLGDLTPNSSAKITDKGLISRIATPNGVKVREVMKAVSSHANAQGGKAAEELTREAKMIINAVADGSEKASAVMNDFFEILRRSAGEYDEKAAAAHIEKIKPKEGSEVLVTEPFFGGNRAWVAAPASVEDLGAWKHGISKLDEVQAPESIDAPDVGEIKGVAEYVIGLGEIVKLYQSNLKQLDELNKELDKAAGKASNSEKEDRAQLNMMQVVMPRILKGPQVDAYAYAAHASTLALAYCVAGVRAHRGAKSKAQAEAGAGA